MLSPPTAMPLCPLQTGSPMTCCKHLSHIGPPWPNGLPGLPEVAQHCLFADTVLPCRTCRRLKTMSKVRQPNGPVHSRVCNPQCTGSSAICHPTCLLETLVQPNYCVSVTTFSTLYSTYFHFKYTLKRRLQFVSIWSSLKFCRLVID